MAHPRGPASNAGRYAHVGGAPRLHSILLQLLFPSIGYRLCPHPQLVMSHSVSAAFGTLLAGRHVPRNVSGTVSCCRAYAAPDILSLPSAEISSIHSCSLHGRLLRRAAAARRLHADEQQRTSSRLLYRRYAAGTCRYTRHALQ